MLFNDISKSRAMNINSIDIIHYFDQLTIKNASEATVK